MKEKNKKGENLQGVCYARLLWLLLERLRALPPWAVGCAVVSATVSSSSSSSSRECSSDGPSCFCLPCRRACCERASTALPPPGG